MPHPDIALAAVVKSIDCEKEGQQLPIWERGRAKPESPVAIAHFTLEIPSALPP